MINLYLQGESYPNTPDIFHFNFITKYSIKKYINIIFITSTLILNQGEIIFKFIKTDRYWKPKQYIYYSKTFIFNVKFIYWIFLHIFIYN